MLHFTDELVSTALLADRYRAAERAYLLQTMNEWEHPGRDVLVRIGRVLVALGRRLEALEAGCAKPLDAVAAREC